MKMNQKMVMLHKMVYQVDLKDSYLAQMRKLLLVSWIVHQKLQELVFENRLRGLTLTVLQRQRVLIAVKMNICQVKEKSLEHHPKSWLSFR